MPPAGGPGLNPPTPALARRLASMTYESLVVVAILLAASLPFAGAPTGRLEGLTRHLFQAYLVLVVGVYFVWCWRRGGQTLPMRAWKLRILRRDGAPVATPRAILRYALAASALGSTAVAAVVLWREPHAAVAWIAATPGLVTILWCLVDRDRQFLHDRLAGTRTVFWEPANAGLIAAPPTTSARSRRRGRSRSAPRPPRAAASARARRCARTGCSGSERGRRA